MSDHCCPSQKESISPKVSKKLWVTLLLFLLLLFSSQFIPFLKPLQSSLSLYIGLIWGPVLLGLIFGGVIDYFVPDEFIFKYLGRRKKRTIIYSALAGVMMSACSHGILAIAIQLYKKGASIPSVIAFLLASPWANLPMTILLIGFFKWKAFLIIGSAIMIAIVVGYLFMFLQKMKWIEPSSDDLEFDEISWSRVKDFNLKESVKGVFKGSLDLANMILWWSLIGLIMAAVISAYVPGHFFIHYLNPEWSGLLVDFIFCDYY